MRGGFRNWALGAWSVLALVYLFIPIAIVVLYSFNDPKGRYNITWEGFTLDHWLHPFQVEGLQEALTNSLLIALLATALAIVLGTLMALALVRYGFKGRGAANLFIFLPLATPEVVLGAALLGLFITMGVATGFATILIAHTMFSVSYVVVTIRARLQGLDTHLEEAAMDLGANEWTAFRKVTLPIIAPGIAAAALLSFALSVDDFVITNFTAGQTSTFPLFIWGAARQGVPAEVNVLATALLLAVLVLMALNVLWQRRKARSEAALIEPRAVVAPGLAQ
ncbi:MAG TPA: ABC transporter permease [Solirubrobacteraceae bacterium]|nr:ABC transporter permease [Solirubrobacteraceae bacterium]